MTVARPIRPFVGSMLSFGVGFALMPLASGIQASDWQTLTSEHFAIHYEQPQQALAERVVRIAETLHPKLVAEVGWEPAQRTQIRITDDYDFSNGWATPLPYNRMTFYAFPPDSLNQLEDYDDWLTLLFTHEYTHILHLDQSRGLPDNLQAILGRHFLTFPGLFNPGFITEGLATYQETDPERGVGRGQSSLYRMMMRAEVARGIAPIEQVNLDGRLWPYGKSYLYGVYFQEFLRERYGANRVQEYLRQYSGQIIPYFLNSSARSVFGIGYEELWQQFDGWLQQRFQAEITQRQQQSTPPSQALTQGQTTAFESWVVGNDVYYLRTDAHQHAALMKRENNGEARVLVETNPGSHFDVSPNSHVLVTQLQADDKLHQHYELFVLRDGCLRQVPDSQSVIRARWLPGNQQVVALQVQAGVPRLLKLNTDSGESQLLWQGELGDVLGDFSLHPQGQQLIAARKRDFQTWNLERLDLATGAWTPLTQTTAIESAPRYDANGEAILFSADYDGVYNLYRMRLEDGRLERLTQVTGGAFQPGQLRSGDLIYVGYQPEGYDLFQSAAAPQEVVSPQADTRIASPWQNQPVPAYTRDDYSVWPSILPTSWFPLFGATDITTELGATTYGTDASGKHAYDVAALYETESGQVSGYINYLYDWGLTGQLQTLVQRINSYDQLGDELARVRGEDKIEITHHNAWTAADRHWRLDYGVAGERDHSLWRRDEGIPQSQAEDSRWVGFGLTFDNRTPYQTSLDFAEGRQVEWVLESNSLIDNDFTGTGTTLDWQEFIHLRGRQVLKLRVATGIRDDGMQAYELSGSNNLFKDLSLLGREDYRLRGYPDGDLIALRGHRMQLNSIAWQFPLADIEQTWGMIPLGIHRISGETFVDSGSVWEDGYRPGHYYTGIGAEVRIEWALMGLGQLDTSLGFASGLDEPGEEQFYLRLTAPFMD